MNSVIIIHGDEGDCTLPLLSQLAAMARVPSLSEVIAILPDLNLGGQCKGLLSFAMQQPGLQVLLGRLMGLLDHVASTERRLKCAQEAKEQMESLLGEEQTQVALLLEVNATLQTSLQWQEALVANASVYMEQVTSERDAAVAEVSSCQGTIRDLEEQLEAKAAVESMAPSSIDLDFLDEMDDDSSSFQSAATEDLDTELPCAREAKLHKEAEEQAAAAEAALQQTASLEAKLQTEQEYSAWLVQRREKAENVAAAAAQEASAEAQHCQQLQEQLQYKNASCTSLVVALASERVTRAKAEQRAAECKQTAREHTLLAAAAEQKSSSLEAAMQQQEDIFANKIACLATEIEQVKADVATAKDEANAEAWSSKKLQERLRRTEADRDSFAAGLKAEQEAHAETKQTLAGGQRAHGDHVPVLGLFAQQQTGAKEAMEAENRTLRSRLACLEEQLRHASAAADPGPPASNPISPPTTPVRLAAGASSGADDTPAGALEHIAPQAAEVEQEPLLGTLSAQEAQESVDYARKRGWGRGGYQKLCQQDMEEQLRHESAAASRASAPSKRISTPTAPADPAAAASSGAGSASAGAAEHMASQALEVEQEALLGSVSAREAQESVDHAAKRGWGWGWGWGRYQKLGHHDLS